MLEWMARSDASTTIYPRRSSGCVVDVQFGLGRWTSAPEMSVVRWHKRQRPVVAESVRLRTLLAMIAVAAFGLAAKLYPGPGRWWINNWGPASVAYVVFFMLAAFLIFPLRERATRIAACVLLVTCGLEFVQPWHPLAAGDSFHFSRCEPAGHQSLMVGLSGLRGRSRHRMGNASLVSSE